LVMPALTAETMAKDNIRTQLRITFCFISGLPRKLKK